MDEPVVLKSGDFIRVKQNSNDSRRGKDGMVHYFSEDGCVGLTFGCDRYGNYQRCECVGVEMWQLDELDLTTLDSDTHEEYYDRD